MKMFYGAMKMFYIVTLSCVLASCAPTTASDELLFDAIVQRNHSQMAEAIRNGADVNNIGLDGWTPITLSASRKDVQAVELLLKSGANVESFDGGGNTSLFWATYTENYELVDVLLSTGADPCRFKGHGQSAASIAARMGKMKLVKLYGPCTKVPGPTP